MHDVPFSYAIEHSIASNCDPIAKNAMVTTAENLIALHIYHETYRQQCYANIYIAENAMILYRTLVRVKLRSYR
jgi:hypothetical protein